MLTQCPKCATVFDLGEIDLEQSGGRVRCGECLSVFTALEHVANEDAALDDEDDREFAETGVGWILLAQDPDARPDDSDKAHYVGAGDSEAWSRAGQPVDRDASNAPDSTVNPNEPRYDDDTPFVEPDGETDDPPDEADGDSEPVGDDGQAVFTETAAYEPAPVTFELVGSDGQPGGNDPSTDDANASPDDGDPNRPGITTPAAAGGESPPDDDWSMLLEEIDTLPGVEESAAQTLVDSTDDVERPDGDDDNDDDYDPDRVDAASDFADDPASMPADAQAGIADGNAPGEPAPIDDEAHEADTGTADEPEFLDSVFDEFSAEPDDGADPPADTDSDEDPDDSGIFVSETEMPDDEGEPTTIDDSGILVYEPDDVPAEDDIEDSAEHIVLETTDEPKGTWTPPAAFETAVSVAVDKAGGPGRFKRLVVVLLSLIGAAQYVHFNREHLATKAAFAGPLDAIYGDSLVPDWDIGNICYEKRTSYAADGVLVVYAQLANRGAVAQPYPLVHVTLAGRYGDANGSESLGHRLVTPADYLEGDNTDALIGPGVRFEAVTRLSDPGDAVGGYTVEACYRRANGTLHCNGGCSG